jgi:CheY-like chemotaxis protein
MDFANSAADALARIASTIERSLILILSDINMPGMTGLEMQPKVKEMRPDVPVIMITAYGDPDTRRKALESGATGLLTKPIDFAALRGSSELCDQRATRPGFIYMPAHYEDFRLWPRQQICQAAPACPFGASSGHDPKPVAARLLGFRSADCGPK